MIASKRLTLTRPHGDITAIDIQVAWLNDLETVRYSEQRFKTHTRETQTKYVRSFHWPDFFLEIRDKTAKNELIGTITAYVDRYNWVADMGLLIARPYWGNGYGIEAWTRLRDYLFGSGIRKIEAGTMALNCSMIGICLKSGMKEEGRRRDHFLIDGGYTDLVYFGQLR